MPLMPRRGKTVIGGAHPEVYPCALRIILIERLVRLWPIVLKKSSVALADFG
jgi:hypothetical protein